MSKIFVTIVLFCCAAGGCCAGDRPPAWVNAVDANAMEGMLNYTDNEAVLTYSTLDPTNCA